MTSSTAVVPSLSIENFETLEDEKSSLEQFRKLFIGGLTYTTTDDRLKEYCSKYGDITDCTIMRDKEGRSRGFAFVSFKDRSMVNNFMDHRPHTIDGRKTEPKRAMSRDEASKPDGQLTVKKVFIGGIKSELTEDELKTYFQKYGNIIECNIMKDKEDKLRGFAFITFDDYDSVDRCILEKPHLINKKELDVRKAIPRQQISRHNNSILPTNNTVYNNNNSNPEFYSQMNIVPNYSALYPSFYPYVNSSSYFSKPMPLMSTTNSNTQINDSTPTTLFVPPDVPNNNIQYQNDNRKKTGHEQALRSRLINGEQNRKIFLGGLSVKTTDESLKAYVKNFGDISDCLVMKNQQGQSKRFGFVTFIDPNTVDEFMKQRPHVIDGRQIDPKRAMPREEANNDDVHITVKKIFIGGIRDGITEDGLRNYFQQYGNINSCLLMLDKDGKTRGFAFLEFDDYDSVDKIILSRPHKIGEHTIDVKKAIPKDQRQLQIQQQQQQQQQHQYSLQMQAAAAAAYYYYSLPYHIINNPIASSVITQNNTVKNDVIPHIQTSKNNNNISNSAHRILGGNNHHQQSSCGSQ